MKRNATSSGDAKSRRKRALTVIARTKPSERPPGANLVDFRDPSPAERAHGKSLEARARELLAGAKRSAKLRKLAISH
jgi:hypothetical protein